MENYIYKYLVYNSVLLKFMEEDRTLKYLRNVNEDEVSKSELKKFTESTEIWAKFAHDKNIYYPVAVYENDEPKCYISMGSEIIEVHFLDERMFQYIIMSYDKYNDDFELYPDNKIFLSEILVRKFNYQEKEMLHDLNSDKVMIFTPEGKLTVRTSKVFREPSVRFQEEEFESKELVNVSHNWLPMPTFGDYGYLCNYDKILKQGDLLSKAITDDDNLKE
jgi:hypothetical protein